MPSYNEQELQGLIDKVQWQINQNRRNSAEKEERYKKKYNTWLNALIVQVVREHFGRVISDAVARLKRHFGI